MGLRGAQTHGQAMFTSFEVTGVLAREALTCGVGRVSPNGTRLGLRDEAVTHELVSVLRHDGVPLRG